MYFVVKPQGITFNMKWLFKGKDGGEESKVYGYWLFESKRFGSIVLLNFKQGSREAYHTHAFNSISWILYGRIREDFHNAYIFSNIYGVSLIPIITTRSTFHKVSGLTKNTWILSFRGGWVDKWLEYLPAINKVITLTHGRKQI